MRTRKTRFYARNDSVIPFDKEGWSAYVLIEGNQLYASEPRIIHDIGFPIKVDRSILSQPIEAITQKVFEYANERGVREGEGRIYKPLFYRFIDTDCLRLRINALEIDTDVNEKTGA